MDIFSTSKCIQSLSNIKSVSFVFEGTVPAVLLVSVHGQGVFCLERGSAQLTRVREAVKMNLNMELGLLLLLKLLQTIRALKDPISLRVCDHFDFVVYGKF